MNSKERVHRALRREPVDRVPVFMWFHPETAKRFAARLDIPVSRLPEAMGDDIRQTWVNNNYAMEGIVHQYNGESHVDEWGVRWVKDGPFNQAVEFPLANLSADEVRAYRFPVDRLEYLLSLMNPILAQREDYFIGCDVSPCVFEMYWRLRGMEQTLLDIALEPELTRDMFNRCAEFARLLSKEACKRFPLDWLWTGDDVAGQEGLLFSRNRWRDLVMPGLARIFAVGKEHHLWVACHCCGALYPIIADLIEIGLDVLNPIQCNCRGMNPFDLKREFGDRLAFMGGVDTQQLLPFGTAKEVRMETERLMDGMTTDGGGYILAASHTIPPETPDENIFALYQAAGIGREEILDRAAEIRKSCGAD
ncbi:MAG TPA: uroporphyrinogen decarboxylase family protein [bacterium]|nr:uroporphyrinogen decarboxylase family protein [bacterium]